MKGKFEDSKGVIWSRKSIKPLLKMIFLPQFYQQCQS